MTPALALALAFAVQAPGGEVTRGELTLVDGVAAVVGTEVITRSEIDAEARVVLVGRAGPAALDRAIDDGFRARVLDYVIVQELLAEEARREHRIVVRETAVDDAVSELRASLQPAGGLARLLAVARVPEEDVRAILRRDLAVKELLAKVLADGGPIPAGEVSRYLEEHPALLEGRPPAERRRAAEAELKRELRERRFSLYVEGLRKNTEVRLVADYGAP